ncbi:cytochrome c biogenesis protein ResB [Cyclobacterium jeungdonense]
MGINFIFHSKKYKLYRQKKWPVGLFHLAFICILLGAGITRYFSTEGTMLIREGEASGVFFSSGNYPQLE